MEPHSTSKEKRLQLQCHFFLNCGGDSPAPLENIKIY